jgi:hypothetical protein
MITGVFDEERKRLERRKQECEQEQFLGGFNLKNFFRKNNDLMVELVN